MSFFDHISPKCIRNVFIHFWCLLYNQKLVLIINRLETLWIESVTTYKGTWLKGPYKIEYNIRWIGIMREQLPLDYCYLERDRYQQGLKVVDHHNNYCSLYSFCFAGCFVHSFDSFWRSSSEVRAEFKLC